MADSLIDPPMDQNERDELLNKWKDKSKEEILAAKVESDLFIKTQNARFDNIRDDYLRLREEHQTSAQLKDLIEQLKQKPPEVVPPQDTNKDSVQSLKPEEIEALLDRKLTDRELISKQTTNFNTVRAKLKEQFGDKAGETLKQRMDTLGLDQQFTDDLAKNHPTVFFKTFGLDEAPRQDTFAPPRSNQRTDRFAPVVPKRDWNYYQELLKNDPRGYLDPKIAIQMHDDAIALGPAFGLPEDDK